MSATQSVYVAPAVVSSSTTLTASPASTTAGQQITLTAEVETSGGAANPTGTVTFSSGGITLGRVALNSNSIAAITLSSAGMTPGSYPVIAKYSGDAYNLPSTSTLAKVTLEAVTTTTLQVTPTNPAPGQSVSLVATVARQQSAGNAAGTVSYSLDGYTFGTATLNAHGVATLVFPTTGIPAGTYSVLATFEGTALDQQSISAPVTITVQ